MLSKLERDRAVTHMMSLQTALDQIATHKETTNKLIIVEAEAQASDANQNRNVKKQSELARQEGAEDEVKQQVADQVAERKKDVKVRRQ